MINSEQMTVILRYLDSANLSGAKNGQVTVWLDVISAKFPQMRMEDAQQACRELASRRTASKGDTWITPGDLITEVKKIRSDRLARIGSAYRGPDGLTGTQEREWTKRFIAAVGDGLEVEQAISATDRALRVTRAEIETGPLRPIPEVLIKRP